MPRSDIMAQLDELFELDAGTLNGPEELEAIGWDSVRAIEFIVLAEERAGVEILPDSLKAAKTVNDLLALLGEKASP